MPGKVVTIQHPESSLAERLYLPILAGMALTFRKFVTNVLSRKVRPTIEYPEERRDYSDRYRGRHILKTREDGMPSSISARVTVSARWADSSRLSAKRWLPLWT